MAELTIHVPDELAQRLKPHLQHLPELLWQLLEKTTLPASTEAEEKGALSTDIPAVYQEVLDFLITRPTPTQISSFKVSPQAQHHLEVLLEKNRSGTITSMEVEELDVYEQLDHLMMLLKARAFAVAN